MKKELAFLLASCLVLTACAGSRTRLEKAAQSGDEIVEAEGIAPYHADDVPGSKAASLAAAQRSAVELVVGVYVDAKTLVDKAVAIQNQILTHTAGYVKQYQILSEGPSGQWYKTRIRALVSTHSIHEDLDAMGLLRQPGVGNPRVAFAVQEWIGENQDGSGNATQTLAQALLSKGFQVVELPSSVNKDEDPADIATNTAKGYAEIIIAGLARAQSLGYSSAQLGGMASFRASISLRALEVGTGDVIMTVSETASGLEATPQLAAAKALQNAAQLAAKDLYPLPQELDKRSHITIGITGLSSFDALSNFEKSLTSTPGVKDFYLRSYSQSSGVAELDVHAIAMDPQTLADNCAKIGGPTWSVYKVEGRTIQLSANQAGH